MPTKNERLIQDALHRISAINDILGNDAIRGLRVLKEIFEAEEEAQTDLWRVPFGIRVATLSFFALVDGLSYAMRNAVTEIGPKIGLVIPERDNLRLQEKRRASNGTILTKFLAPDESLRLACKWYPTLFGATFRLNTDDREWQALLELKEVRNGLSHPKSVDDVAARNGLARVQPCVVWFNREMPRLLAACEASILGRIKPRPDPVIPVFKPPDKLGPLLSDQENADIRNSLQMSFQYFKVAVPALNSHTIWALSLVNSESNFLSPDAQFHLRTLVRTLDANIQGAAFFLRDFILASSERGEIRVSEEERQRLEKEEPLNEYFVSALNIWSDKFGTGNTLRQQGEEWRAFKQVLNLRNKLVHPRTPASLRISIDGIQNRVLKATSWFSDSLAYFECDPAKLDAALARSG